MNAQLVSQHKSSLWGPVKDTGIHFLRVLWHTPLLLGWLLVGPLVALLLDGLTGLMMALLNLVLIGIYAIVIRAMTPNPPSAEPVKCPRLELALAVGLLALTLLVQLLDFGVWRVQPIQSWVRGFFDGVNIGVYAIDWIPDYFRQDLFIAASTTIKQLIPTLLLFLLLGVGRKGMGLAGPHWKLVTILVGSTAALGLATGVLLRAPILHVIGLYLIGIFVNALPEELFFRGMLLPRLEKFFANPLNALVISALLFNAIHIPIEMNHGASLWQALLDMFSTAYPSGLIWGYLYLRTRSILPGVLWHAANGNLGFILMDF